MDDAKTTKELLAELNALRAIGGDEPIAKWKRSRSDLEAALAKYDDDDDDEDEDETSLDEALADALDPLADDVEAPATERMLREEYGIEPRTIQTDDGPVLREGEPEAHEVAAEILATLEPRAKSPRGAIGVLVMDLLQTDAPYRDIVAQVRATYWDAKTTERSVASVAMDLRRDGVEVPPRRKPAAIKAVKQSTVQPVSEPDPLS